MAAYTYYRLLIYGDGGDAVAVAELKFYDSTSALIPTTGGTSLASSTYPGQPVANAFDGNASSFWNSNNTPTNAAPEWLRYQFASAVDVRSFTVQTRNDSFFYQGPSSFALQGSNDGTAWTTLGNYGAAWTSAGQTITFNNISRALGPAYRLLITASQDGSAPSIAEWKLFDSTGAQITADNVNGASSCSSIFNRGQFSGAFAFDANVSTWWASANVASSGAPEWLAYRFTSTPPAIYSFSIQARGGASYSQSPSVFSMQSSPDGVTWTTVQAWTATWTSSAQVITFGVAMISVSPTSSTQGTALTLTVTGSSTNFVSGTTTVAFSGTGITVGAITVASATSLTVAITIGLTATTGARTMTVTTGSESASATFTVAAGMFERGKIAYDQIRITSRHGAGAKIQMFGGGSAVAGNVAVFDADGNVIDGGTGSGGGSGGGGASGVLPIRSVSANTTMSNSDYTVVATAASITITLPTSPATGQFAAVKNGNATAGQTVTVSAGSIDGASSVVLDAAAAVEVQWDGSQWRIVTGFGVFS